MSNTATAAKWTREADGAYTRGEQTIIRLAANTWVLSEPSTPDECCATLRDAKVAAERTDYPDRY